MVTKKLNVDAVGALAGLICGVHCVGIALFFAVAPVLNLGFLKSHAVDYAFLGLALLLGPWGAWRGYTHHGKIIPPLMILLGVGLVTFAMLFVGHSHEKVNITKSLFSATGGLLLAAGHFANNRIHQRACCAEIKVRGA